MNSSPLVFTNEKRAKQFIQIVKKKLDKYEEQPISNFDILKVLPDVKIITFADLKNLSKFPFDANNRLVIFYEMGSEIGHWVCVIYYPESDTASWFDSYGFKVGGALSGISKKELQVLGENKNYAKEIMKGYKNAVYNPFRFQSLKDAQTCGKHVCTRLIMQHLGVKEYVHWMNYLSKYSGLSPDEVVSVIAENPSMLN